MTITIIHYISSILLKCILFYTAVGVKKLSTYSVTYAGYATDKRLNWDVKTVYRWEKHKEDLMSLVALIYCPVCWPEAGR